jgi:hypothetical protein
MPTRTSTKRSSKRGTTKGRGQGRSGSSKGRSSSGRSSGGTRARGSAGSKITWDHDQIRRWAEQRGGEPACVKGTGGGGDEGVLRIDFPGYSGADSLRHIDWEEWFDKFDGAYLALVYQDKTKGGQRSNFNKLVSRSEAKRFNRGGGSRSGGSRSGGSRGGGSRAGGSSKSRSKSASGRHGRSR